MVQVLENPNEQLENLNEQIERAGNAVKDAWWNVHLYTQNPVTDEQIEDIISRHPELNFEVTAEGDLVIMPPTYTRTGNRNFNLNTEFGIWVRKDGTGAGFDSSTLFTLPNGARRAPDVSWISKKRLATLDEKQKEKFVPLCPDFVIELRSATDNLKTLQAKMREYIANGAQLGWLLDPNTRHVYVYRADGSVEDLDNPASLAGDPVLPGFVLDVHVVWNADF